MTQDDVLKAVSMFYKLVVEESDALKLIELLNQKSRLRFISVFQQKNNIKFRYWGYVFPLLNENDKITFLTKNKKDLDVLNLESALKHLPIHYAYPLIIKGYDKCTSYLRCRSSDIVNTISQLEPEVFNKYYQFITLDIKNFKQLVYACCFSNQEMIRELLVKYSHLIEENTDVFSLLKAAPEELRSEIIITHQNKLSNAFDLGKALEYIDDDLKLKFLLKNIHLFKNMDDNCSSDGRKYQTLEYLLGLFDDELDQQKIMKAVRENLVSFENLEYYLINLQPSERLSVVLSNPEAVKNIWWINDLLKLLPSEDHMKAAHFCAEHTKSLSGFIGWLKKIPEDERYQYAIKKYGLLKDEEYSFDMKEFKAIKDLLPEDMQLSYILKFSSKNVQTVEEITEILPKENKWPYVLSNISAIKSVYKAHAISYSLEESEVRALFKLLMNDIQSSKIEIHCDRDIFYVLPYLPENERLGFIKKFKSHLEKKSEYNDKIKDLLPLIDQPLFERLIPGQAPLIQIMHTVFGGSSLFAFDNDDDGQSYTLTKLMKKFF